MKALSIDEIELLREKVLQNAGDLLVESVLLFKNERYARAYTLSQFACEELAKLPMLVRVGQELALKNSVDWKKFFSRFRSHKAKIDGIHHFNYLNSEIRSDDSDVSAFKRDLESTVDIDRLKNASLYAEISSDNKIAKPADVISRETAQAIIKRSKELFDTFREIEEKTLGKIEIASTGNEELRKLFELLKNGF